MSKQIYSILQGGPAPHTDRLPWLREWLTGRLLSKWVGSLPVLTGSIWLVYPPLSGHCDLCISFLPGSILNIDCCMNVVLTKYTEVTKPVVGHIVFKYCCSELFRCLKRVSPPLCFGTDCSVPQVWPEALNILLVMPWVQFNVKDESVERQHKAVELLTPRCIRVRWIRKIIGANNHWSVINWLCADTFTITFWI